MILSEEEKHRVLSQLLFIAAGGAVGSVLRYVLSSATQRWWSGQYAVGGLYPVGTIVVNLIGCLCIGFCVAKFGRWQVPQQYQLAVIVGLLGGFTTFSAYGWDIVRLGQENHLAVALWTLVISNAGGVLAVWIGYRLAS